jgi:tRNA pseudouridine55 synthase
MVEGGGEREGGARGAPVSPSGVYLVDKPLGRSSMDVCRWVRRRLVLGGAPKRVKVGHGGTLDPLATGLIVVLVGKATRMCEVVMKGVKEYAADVDLSACTATDDAEGAREEVVPTPGWPVAGAVAGVGGVPAGHMVEPGSAVVGTRGACRVPTEEEVRGACARFVGEVMQRPPAFSALKVEGQRAYDLARRGEAVELAARVVRIEAVEVEAYAWPVVRVRVRSGKGVYIRSLARDLGAALGVGGTLMSLRRTRTGAFDVKDAVRLEALPERMGQGDLMGVERWSG